MLSAAGYTAIPLKLTTSLLLDVNAEVNGKTMILCLDTGAQDAMSLDRSSAHRAGLVVEEDPNATVQLGGALTNGRTKVEHLVVGRFAVPTDAQVTDFSPSNASRKGLNDVPCDGTLNGGLLKEYSAIIDYADQKLYLLGNPGDHRPGDPRREAAAR